MASLNYRKVHSPLQGNPSRPQLTVNRSRGQSLGLIGSSPPLRIAAQPPSLCATPKADPFHKSCCPRAIFTEAIAAQIAPHASIHFISIFSTSPRFLPASPSHHGPAPWRQAVPTAAPDSNCPNGPRVTVAFRLKINTTRTDNNSAATGLRPCALGGPDADPTQHSARPVLPDARLSWRGHCSDRLLRGSFRRNPSSADRFGSSRTAGRPLSAAFGRSPSTGESSVHW